MTSYGHKYPITWLLRHPNTTEENLHDLSHLSHLESSIFCVFVLFFIISKHNHGPQNTCPMSLCPSEIKHIGRLPEKSSFCMTYGDLGFIPIFCSRLCWVFSRVLMRLNWKMAWWFHVTVPRGAQRSQASNSGLQLRSLCPEISPDPQTFHNIMSNLWCSRHADLLARPGKRAAGPAQSQWALSPSRAMSQAEGQLPSLPGYLAGAHYGLIHGCHIYIGTNDNLVIKA